MAKYIDADALMAKMWNVCGEEDAEIEKGRVKWDSGLWLRYKVFEETISDFPAADVRENVRGEWVADELETIVCSICKKPRRDNRVGHTNYCNSCGADMRGEANVK